MPTHSTSASRLAQELKQSLKLAVYNIEKTCSEPKYVPQFNSKTLLYIFVVFPPNSEHVVARLSCFRIDFDSEMASEGCNLFINDNEMQSEYGFTFGMKSDSFSAALGSIFKLIQSKINLPIKRNR